MWSYREGLVCPPKNGNSDAIVYLLRDILVGGGPKGYLENGQGQCRMGLYGMARMLSFPNIFHWRTRGLPVLRTPIYPRSLPSALEASIVVGQASSGR